MRWMRRARPLPDAVRKAAGDFGLGAEDLEQPPLMVDEARWVLAATPGPVLVSDEGAQLLGYWYEIQHAAWSAKKRTLTITWVDPQRDVVDIAASDKDPRGFMTVMRQRLDYYTVLTLRRLSEEGTAVIASVRRRLDGGLFSTLVAYGPLDEAGMEMANELERTAREQAGLDA